MVRKYRRRSHRHQRQHAGSSTVSVLARVLYNYKGQVPVQRLLPPRRFFRLLHTGNQWQNFYSVGLGWLMSEEAWMKDITWLDMLKPKGSWGTLGNQNLDRAYPAEPLLTNAYSAVFGTPSAIYPGYQLAYLPNPKLRWEKVEAWGSRCRSQLPPQPPAL